MTEKKGRFGVHGGQYIPETLMNAVIEHTHLAVLFEGLLISLSRDAEGIEGRLPTLACFLLSLLRDTRIHGHTPYPGLLLAASLKLGESPPQVDEGFLYQVLHIIRFFAKHHANGIYRGFMLPHHLRKTHF